MLGLYTCILELLTVTLLTRGESTNPVLSLLSTNNKTVELHASLRVGDYYRLRCQYTAPNKQSTSVTILEDNVAQIKCLLLNNAVMETATKTIETVGTRTCTADHFEITVKIAENMASFRCDLYDLAGTPEARNSPPMPINTYTLPSKPIIGVVATPKENQTVTYTCQSTAKPPPKLNFTIDSSNTIATQSITHSPAWEDIFVNTTYAASITTMSVTATESMNGKMLRCQIFDHSSEDASFAVTEVKVIYGPNNNETDETKEFTWDGTNDNSFDLTCSLKSNPPNYSWHHDAAPGSVIETQQTMTIQSDLFADIPLGGRKELVFICTVHNKQNDGKWAQQKFSVTIFRPSGTLPPGDGESTSDPGLQPWMIGLIAAVSAVLLIIVVIIVVCVVRKKVALKKKPKAAAKDDRPSESSKYVPPHHNRSPQQTPSPQLDNTVWNNRGFEATEPADNRYSQNEEQYIHAFDNKPRSRTPVALDELDSLDDDRPPSLPPAYNPGAYYSDYPENAADINHYYSYGAPC